MKNQRNYVASLSQLGRWLGEQAEEAGATILPETAGYKLLVSDGRVLGVRTGDKGRGRNGEELANFEPGSDIRARVTVLAEGTQGHLTGVAIDHFGLQGENPQVWALGVKEVWKVAKPLDRVIHTLGWPLRPKARFREFGGSFIYPMGDDMVTIGMVVGLDYRDVQLSVHDLLQELKTHSLVRNLLEGGERVAWGAKTIPEGGLLSLPSRLHAPGLLITGDGAGFVNVPALKGIHYAVESGRLAAEAAFHAIGRGETPWRPGGLDSYDVSVRESFIWKDLQEVRNMRQVFGRGFWMGSALAGMMTVTKGKLPPGPFRTERDSEHDLVRSGRRRAVREARREADVRQAVERLPEREPDARRRAGPPARPASCPARPGGAVGVDVPGAGLCARARRRERRCRGRGDAVQLRPVRRHHREGRPADASRGRLRARVHVDLGPPRRSSARSRANPELVSRPVGRQRHAARRRCSQGAARHDQDLARRLAREGPPRLDAHAAAQRRICRARVRRLGGSDLLGRETHLPPRWRRA